MRDLIERLRAEQRERWRGGERVCAEEYLARHPELLADDEHALEVIYQEVMLREELGEAPQAHEYQARFPRLAERLGLLFEVHGVLDTSCSCAEEVPPTAPAHESDRHASSVNVPVIPGYEVLEKLGQGGMAVVYKARQTGLDRLVAVKVLRPQTSCAPAFAARFAREAQALARLAHPNVVGVHDFGQADGFCYLVMEYVEGSDLRRALASGPLAPEKALGIAGQLCDALQFAHDQGVIHRDIKPDNVLLDRHGRVKVADFGLAKLLGPRGISLTGSHQAMGTWHYMAPEQMSQARDVDHRADIYSLGVTLQELLTGKPPARPARCAAMPAPLRRVVERATQKDPARRYQSAAEMKADIEAVAAELPARRARLAGYVRWALLSAVGLLLLLLGSCAGAVRAFAAQ